MFPGNMCTVVFFFFCSKSVSAQMHLKFKFSKNTSQGLYILLYIYNTHV